MLQWVYFFHKNKNLKCICNWFWKWAEFPLKSFPKFFKFELKLFSRIRFSNKYLGLAIYLRIHLCRCSQLWSYFSRIFVYLKNCKKFEIEVDIFSRKITKKMSNIGRSSFRDEFHLATRKKKFCLSGFCDMKMFRGIPPRHPHVAGFPKYLF